MKVKQIFAQYNQNNIGTTNIQAPLNEFIKTLRFRGKEIKEISYSFDQKGNIQCAIVLYGE